MKKRETIRILVDGIRKIRAFPSDGHPRRTDDGYPLELCYDEFSYKRIVDCYREGLQKLLAAAEIEETA